MAQAVSTTKTGFDSTTDPVASATETTFATSVEQIINNILNGVQEFDQQLFEPASPNGVYSIVSGALALNGAAAVPTQKMITVSPETGAQDNLDTIGVSNNRSLVIKAYSGTNIYIRHGHGNITTPDGTDFLVTGNLVAELWCQNSQWSLIGPGQGILNVESTRDPGSNDHSGSLLSVGSLWSNTAKDQSWMALDVTAGAGVWGRLTQPKNWLAVRAANATALGIGVVSPTTANSPASANDSTNTWMTLPTTNVSGNLGGFVSTTFTIVRPSHSPIFECTIKMDATILTERVWIGLTSADVTNVDTLAAGTKFLGFRWSTVAADVGFCPVQNDGATQYVGSPIGTVVAGNTYKLRIRVDGDNGLAYFSVNDSAEQSPGSNFPAVATDMGFVCRVITTSAAIRLINFSTMKLEW